MQKIEGTMDINKYAEISNDVWQIFKKYLPEDADLMYFSQDIHKLDEKYRNIGEVAYRFMQKLTKVYFDELRDIKG